MKKRVMILALAISTCVALSACGGSGGSTNAGTEAAGDGEEDVGPTSPTDDTPQVNADNIDKLIEEMRILAVGHWEDRTSKRAYMDIEADPDNDTGYSGQIYWGSGVSEGTQWDFYAIYQPDMGALLYKDCVKKTITYNDDGQVENEEIQYEGGTGTLLIVEGDKLSWVDDMEEKDAGCIFVKTDSDVLPEYEDEEEGGGPMPGMPNPWTDTVDLQEAVDGSGVSFKAIPELALPGELGFDLYRYMDDMIEVIFSDDSHELRVRASNNLEGTDLSGDYNTYAQSWDEEMSGVTVHCQGSGEAVNLAFADIEGVHYCFSYDTGDEEGGLTREQLGNLIDGIVNE